MLLVGLMGPVVETVLLDHLGQRDGAVFVGHRNFPGGDEAGCASPHDCNSSSCEAGRSSGDQPIVRPAISRVTPGLMATHRPPAGSKKASRGPWSSPRAQVIQHGPSRSGLSTGSGAGCRPAGSATARRGRPHDRARRRKHPRCRPVARRGGSRRRRGRADLRRRAARGRRGPRRPTPGRSRALPAGATGGPRPRSRCGRDPVPTLGACPGISIQVTSMDDQSVQVASIRPQCLFAPIPAA